MIKIGDNYYRNLEEQVQYLTNYHDVNQGLAQWGIRVVGQVETEAELPNPSTYDGEYGDAIAVGTEAPFFFYIWTRASIEGNPAYWFPFGEISIVGPEGPRGEQGPIGPQGEASRWYVGSNAPISSSQEYTEGDMYLQSNGQVYRYQNDNWQSIVSIKGPQGIQGPRGIQGPQGPQGPQGIQGDRGDVGGFINIRGILNNQNQLPLPSSLQNLTVAYLVGTASPYDLYIQVGSTAQDAVWTNTGPLNAATMVTVNGQYQNIWDADTKVDKNTASSNGIYGKSAGNEYFYSISQDTTGDTIAIRGITGTLAVGTPTANGHAATKAYVDNLSVTPYILNLGGDVSVSVIIPTAVSVYEEIVNRVYNTDYTSLEKIYPIHGVSTDNNIIVGMYSTDGQTLTVVTSEGSELECESGYPLLRL